MLISLIAKVQQGCISNFSKLFPNSICCHLVNQIIVAEVEQIHTMAAAEPSSSQEKVRESHSKVSIEEKLKLAAEFKVT